MLDQVPELVRRARDILQRLAENERMIEELGRKLGEARARFGSRSVEYKRVYGLLYRARRKLEPVIDRLRRDLCGIQFKLEDIVRNLVDVFNLQALKEELRLGDANVLVERSDRVVQMIVSSFLLDKSTLGEVRSLLLGYPLAVFMYLKYTNVQHLVELRLLANKLLTVELPLVSWHDRCAGLASDQVVRYVEPAFVLRDVMGLYIVFKK